MRLSVLIKKFQEIKDVFPDEDPIVKMEYLGSWYPVHRVLLRDDGEEVRLYGEREWRT